METMKKIAVAIVILYAITCTYIVYLYDQKYFKTVNEMKQRIDELIECQLEREINVPASNEPF